MGACFFTRNSSISLRYGTFYKFVYLRRRIAVKDRSFLYNMYSRVSAVALMDDSDYSSSNCESNSESESNVLRENFHELKNIELFSAVVRVQKSLNWAVAKKIRFSGAVDNYGFDISLTAFKMLVHVYACAEMKMEVFALIREIVCYYQKAELSLFGISYALLDFWYSDTEGLNVVDVLIKVFASNKMLGNAVDVFAQGRRKGLQPGIRVCNFLLKCLAEANEKERILALFKDMKNYGPFPSVYTYTIMIKFYCSGHCKVDIEEAKIILEEMEMIGISPSIVTYSTYIHGLCRVGFIEKAWVFIQKLRHNGQQLNCYFYNAVMHCHVKRGEIDMAKKVFDEMKRYGISADVYSYSILMEGLCRSEREELNNFLTSKEGVNLFKEMDNNHIKPSVVTYSSIIKFFSKNGYMDESFDVFQEIGKSGCEYDQHAYDVLITGFCAQGDMDTANTLLEEMINNNLAPYSVSYKSLILGLCKIGSFEKALSFLNAMTEADFEPDCFTYNHLIYGYCNEGRLEEALQLINEMWDKGISPNVFTFGAIINMLCKGWKSEKALELIPIMLKRDIFPNVVIYIVLVDGFAKQANFKEKAFMFYATILKGGICHDSFTFTILINMLSKVKRVNDAYKVFEDMISSGLAPDTISCTSMIAGFVRIKDMRAAWKIWKKMKERNILPSVVTYTCLIDGFCRINNREMGVKMMREMVLKRLCPDRLAWSFLEELGVMKGSRELFNVMKCKGMVPDEICKRMGL